MDLVLSLIHIFYATESETNSYGTDSTYKTVTDGKSEKPVVIRENPPRIAGVAVVCEGGDSSQIKNTVLEVVKKTLGVDVYKRQL